MTIGAGWRAPLLMALLAMSQLAYALGYYGERSRARRAREGGLRPVMQPDPRHELVEATVTAEAQAQPNA